MINKPDDPANDNYPCADCGAPRTKAQGGTTFTVCDTCWDNRYKKDMTSATECSEKAQELINRLIKSVDVVTDYGDEYELACCGKCQDDLSSYIASFESSVAELTQRAESAEALVREVAGINAYYESIYDDDGNCIGRGCVRCGFERGKHSDNCLFARCKRHAEESQCRG